MDLDINGKTALVTGAGRGIGLAIAKVLLKEGCNVAMNARSQNRVEQVAKNLLEFNKSISVHVADVTKKENCEQLVNSVVDKWGALDFLVCNVGSGRSVSPGEETLEEWQRVMSLNLYATTNMVNAAKNELAKQQGAIVCISSICGIETLGAPVTYSAAKAALNSFVKGISRPLANEGIRINAIAPGNILDDGGAWERKLAEDKKSVEQMLQQEVAQKRLGTPEEIANFAVFALSPKASFATGSIFTIDGGQLRS